MKLIQFIYKDTVIAQQSAEMFLNQIDELKWLLAEAYKCYPDDIEARHVTLETNVKMSDYDLTKKGLSHFCNGYINEAKGIVMTIDETSDEFIDAMVGKNVEEFIEKHLHFKF